MPSWSIHLSLANKLKKELKLADDFIIGNVMPDILVGYMIENSSQIVSKAISHFQDGKPPVINIDKFLKKYKHYLNNSLIKGYLSHLLTDKFYNEYTYKYHYTFDDGRPKIILNDGTKVPALIEKPWQIKQSDFEVYGQKLINNNTISSINERIKDCDVIKECPIDKYDLDKTITKINEISKDKKDYDKTKLRMFTEEELDKIYDECYKKIYDKLSNI